MNTYFNIQRFFWVLKRDLLENGRSALFGMFTVISIFSFILIMYSISSEIDQVSINNINEKIFKITFYILGIFYSGMAFSDFRNKEKTMSYLMLPASALEKFLSILLLTTVGFIISFIIIFGLFNILNMGLMQSFSNSLSLDFYNPFQKNLWANIAVLLPIQSVFLVGAISFKKVPLFYTVLYSFIIGLIYTFILVFISKFMMEDMIKVVNIANGGLVHFNISTQNYNPEFNLLPIRILKIFFQYLLAPTFWIVSWFKLKEKEV